MRRNACWLVLLGLAYAGVASAAKCGHSITSCGCTISEPGTYTVDANLNSTQGLTSRGGCIDITEENVTLVTNAYAITGDGTGTGVGIHLLSGAENAFLEAAGPGDRGFTTLSKWQYGFESETSNVISDDFEYDYNTAGVLLKGARNNNINDFGARGNSVYGAWIKGGSGNQINCSNSDGNGVAGVFVGCSATGPTGNACEEKEQRSSRNFIYDHSAHSSITPQSYGIALETGSRRNIIMENSATSNTVFDLFDGNPNCDSNLWRVNGFTLANQPCIQ